MAGGGHPNFFFLQSSQNIDGFSDENDSHAGFFRIHKKTKPKFRDFFILFHYLPKLCYTLALKALV